MLREYLAILCLSLGAQAGRILVVVPTPSISHQVVFRPLTQELARRGHEVVVITADPAFPKGQAPDNLTEIDVHDLSYNKWRQALSGAGTKGSADDSANQMKIMLSTLSDIFEMQVKTEEVQAVIENKTNHFDLLMIEAVATPALALTQIFKAPTILISSLGGFGGQLDIFGVPTRPVLLYPTPLRQRLFNLTLWEKLKELYFHYYLASVIENQVNNDNKLVKKLFGPDTPSITELASKVDMMFWNLHPIWEFNRPVPPNVIYMGGLHLIPTKELPKDLKSYLDSSKHGVIYISYGTNVSPSQLPPEKIQILVRTFSKLPYDVLWKWDKDELPGRSSNIRISKWLPQSDLLKHPKVKLFITQGGLQSTDEAIAAGVPVIGMPMLGDQWYNVEQYVYRKIGLRLDLATVTEDKFKDAIETVINDRSYRDNMIKLRTLMSDQPQRPLERAVWWAEHVMRHGGAPHLRPRAANMSWAEYLDLELIAFLSACAIIAIVFVSVLLNKALKIVRIAVLRSEKLKSN